MTGIRSRQTQRRLRSAILAMAVTSGWAIPTAQFHKRKAEAENICGQIDQDVRTALLNLNAAKEQVEVAKQNVDLANESLARSKDRFTSGVTHNVEVVQAEQALANANDQYSEFYDRNFAKLSLARALGVALNTRSHRFNEAVTGLAYRLTHIGLSVHSAQQQALARMYAMVTNGPGKGGQISVH